MEDDEKDYLQKIGNRSKYYFDIRKQAIKFIYKNKIQNKDLSVHIIFVAAIWAAHRLNDELAQDDLLIFFGLVSHNDNELDQSYLKLNPDQAHLTLDEILNLTVENYK